MMIDFNNLNISNLENESEFEKKVFFFIKDWFSSSKTVEVQTSGSTGAPKIFEIEKARMINSANMTCDFLRLKEGDSALLCLPIEYISGKMMVVRSIERKLKLIIQEPSISPLENLNETIDFCAMTPLQVENSLDKLHLIKKLIIGGASVSQNLKSNISNLKIPTLIFETYGMSETLSHIALKQVNPISEDYFTVFEGVEISKDERECLKINAPKLNPEILQTNDLVEILNLNSAQYDRKQFKFLGRLDNVINSGGVKIFPEKLEALVKKQISNELVFVGIPDEVLGQKLVLVVEGKDSDEIIHQLSTINYQQKFHKPKEIKFVDKIPRTPNGKVNRLDLLNLLAKQF